MGQIFWDFRDDFKLVGVGTLGKGLLVMSIANVSTKSDQNFIGSWPRATAAFITWSPDLWGREGGGQIDIHSTGF